ncbi:MAG: rhomboid family intramembrane serine protease [Armatimonadia bacterium]
MIPLRDNIPSSTVPYVNYAIIVTCAIVYLAWQLPDAPNLHADFAFNPSHLVSRDALATQGAGPTLLTILTSMFMHGGFMHLGFNMLFLWVFGDNVEDRMGHLRYLIFYLLCGTIAALTHALVSVFASVPVLGASGAIAGVLGAYFVLFRGASIRTLVPFIFLWTIMDIPAVVFLGLWFILQLFSGFGTIGGAGGGVAFWAHIGGFLAGWLLVRRFAVVRRNAPPRPRVIDIRYD